MDTLMAEHCDGKLTDLLLTQADCSKRSVNVHDHCKAVYEGLDCGDASSGIAVGGAI
jgi:hypothetical protein